MIAPIVGDNYYCELETKQTFTGLPNHFYSSDPPGMASSVKVVSLNYLDLHKSSSTACGSIKVNSLLQLGSVAAH